MRSAQILGQARPDVMARLDAAVAQSIAGKDLDATLGDIDGMVTLIETIPSPFGDGGQAQLYATRWIGPHTDGVPGDYTVGVILEGDHYSTCAGSSKPRGIEASRITPPCSVLARRR